MVGEIFAGLSIFKSMLDTARELKNMNDAAVRAAAEIELQAQILDAQTQQSELLRRNAELEQELARLQRWDEEKRRYQLKDFGGNTFAYELKLESSQGEPTHRLCPNCFDQGKKSILQFLVHEDGQDYYDCPACKTRFTFGRFTPSGRDHY